jgi:HEAT repeat protein
MNGDGGRGTPYSSKAAAANALRQLAPDRVSPALVTALRQGMNEDVRAWACWELGKQKDKQSLDALAEASKNDKSARVREAAGAALGERK